MKRCLALAALGAGKVSPNPMVGCVIVHQGQVIGEGWHRQYGGPHAEVMAIADAEGRGYADLLGECTLYVNLEPCSHWGKTPPCADLIIEKGIRRVVIGCIDSYCEVSGRGVAKMRETGIEVEVGVLEKVCMDFNRRFFTAQTLGRPYIILKWAQTSDGFLDAVRPGPELPAAWMTGERARTLVHRWRTEEDAILVGTRTALLDNPSLTARAWRGRNPLRVTIDRGLCLAPDLNIFNGEAPTVLFTTATHLVQAQNRMAGNPNVSVETFGNLSDLLHTLASPPYRVQSLIVEGGAQMLNAFIAEGLWDEARVFTAPMPLRGLYPSELVPNPVGVPAPVWPADNYIVTDDVPESGLKIVTRIPS